MSAAPDLNRTPDLAVLGATTVGYYLAHDLVTTPWKRRLVSLGVLAAGVGVGTRQLKKDAQVGAPGVPRVAEGDTGHGDSGTVGESAHQQDQQQAREAASPRAVALTGAGFGAVVLGTVALGSWFNARVDRVATGVITRTLGRLPLLGGLFRRLPFTTWGIAQLGLVATVERLSEKNPAVAADTGAATGAKTPVTSTAKDAK